MSPRQRRVLAEVADRRGAGWVAATIRSVPDNADPLKALMAADTARVAELRAAIEAEEERERRAKAEERREAPAALRTIEERARAADLPPVPKSAPTPEDPAEVYARGRASAIVTLRAGLRGLTADRLRAKYAITDAELEASRPRIT